MQVPWFLSLHDWDVHGWSYFRYFCIFLRDTLRGWSHIGWVVWRISNHLYTSTDGDKTNCLLSSLEQWKKGRHRGLYYPICVGIIANHYIGFDINFDTPKKGDLWNSLFSSGFSSLPFALNKISKRHYDFGKSDHPIDLQRKFWAMAINNQWLVDRMRIKSTFTNWVTSSCVHSTYKSPVGILHGL